MEEWVSLKECKNYMISNKGRFRNNATGRILTGTKDYAGFRKIRLYENEMHFKDYRTHLLVARYFIANDSPKTKTFVNHIDGDKNNARADNLEWIVPKGDKRNNILLRSGYAVCEYTLSGELIRIWKNASAVSLIYSVAARTIYGAATAQTKTAYGRQWRFYEETKGEPIDDLTTSLSLSRLNKIQEKIKKGDYSYAIAIPDIYLYNEK